MLRKFLAVSAAIGVFLSSSTYAQYNCSNFSGRFWADTEYLYWKIKDSPKIIPLVVEGPVIDNGSPILGLPGTEVVLGGKSIDNKWRSGGKFTIGYWFNDEKRTGIEANYFFLPTGSTKKSVSADGSAGSAFLTFPYFDIITGKESSTGIARPGSYSGVAILKNSNRMQGAELNGFKMFPYSCNSNIALLAGFRWWNFNEKLTYYTSSPNIPPNPRDTYITHDNINAKNNFYGAQLGAKYNYNCRKFDFNITGKLALGAICKRTDFHGYLVTNDFNGFGTPVTYVGGYIAFPSNIGNHKRTGFSVIPEVNVGIGYQIYNCLRLQFGYTFLYASNVAWAGKQAKHQINPTQSVSLESTDVLNFTGPAKPSGCLKSEGLWVQGINVGLAYNF